MRNITRTSALITVGLSLSLFSGCAVFGKLFGGSGGSGSGGGGDSYQAEYDAKDRKSLEDDCATYARKPHGNFGKRGACHQLARLNADELVTLAKAGDWKRIGAYCDGTVVRDVHSNGVHFGSQGTSRNHGFSVKEPTDDMRKLLGVSKVSTFSSKGAACHAKRHGKQQAARRQLASLITSCGSGKEMASAFFDAEFNHREPIYKAKFSEMVQAMATCNQWDDVFEHGMSEIVRGLSVPSMLKAKGYNVEKQFLAYLGRHKSQPLGFSGGSLTAGNMLNWLMAKKKHGHCAIFSGLYPKMPTKVQAQFNIYVGVAKCKKAEQLVAQFLGHDNPNYRVDACWVLGELRSKRYLRNVRGVANTDPEYKVKGLHKHYWVRARCAKAANKIAL